MTTKKLTATLQKSYYGKAVITEDDDFIVLRSYNTDVVAIDKSNNKIIRLWNGWSVTTSKHVNDFLKQNGFNMLSKKEWLALPCINNESVYSVYMSNGFSTYKSNILLTEREADKEVERLEKIHNNRVTAWYE